MAGDEAGSLLNRYLLLVEALRHPDMTKGDCQVLAEICGHAGKDGVAWPSLNRIANRMGVNRSTVVRAVEKLEAGAYLERERAKGRSNTYTLGLASGTGATSEEGGPVARMPPASGTDATTPVAAMPPDQLHPCHPNSALELSSLNQEKRTQLPAALSAFDEGQERSAGKRLTREEVKAIEERVLAELEAQEEPRLTSGEKLRALAVEKERQKRESIRAEYLEIRFTKPGLARGLAETFPKYLADLIEQDKAA